LHALFVDLDLVVYLLQGFSEFWALVYQIRTSDSDSDSDIYGGYDKKPVIAHANKERCLIFVKAQLLFLWKSLFESFDGFRICGSNKGMPMDAGKYGL